MSEIDHDNAAKLARMAGQIADFYRPYPEQTAVEGISTHINKFWTPRMRAEFLTAFPEGDDALDPLLRAARPLIRAASA
ncbi:MAG: formate dehydrogenase subunit delta [Proteobacteria bacterium]|nr:formate dehydrogenase subunit delta [Pseudomonadota bacterium]